MKNGNRSSIVNADINKAPFWKFGKKFRLHDNMRIKTAALNQGVGADQLNSFSEFLLSIGEGREINVANCKYSRCNCD